MNTPVNIEDLHAAMKTALAEKFKGVAVDYYSRPGETVKTPAIFIELDEADAAANGGDIGTEQVDATLRFCAYVVLKFGDGKKLEARRLALSVMAFIQGQRWGQSVGAADVIGAYPDTFKAVNPPANESTQEYETMRVEFVHEALIGADVWEFAADAPTVVNVREQGNEAVEIIGAG